MLSILVMVKDSTYIGPLACTSFTAHGHMRSQEAEFIHIYDVQFSIKPARIVTRYGDLQGAYLYTTLYYRWMCIMIQFKQMIHFQFLFQLYAAWHCLRWACINKCLHLQTNQYSFYSK